VRKLTYRDRLTILLPKDHIHIDPKRGAIGFSRDGEFLFIQDFSHYPENDHLHVVDPALPEPDPANPALWFYTGFTNLSDDEVRAYADLGALLAEAAQFSEVPMQNGASWRSYALNRNPSARVNLVALNLFPRTGPDRLVPDDRLVCFTSGRIQFTRGSETIRLRRDQELTDSSLVISSSRKLSSTQADGIASLAELVTGLRAEHEHSRGNAMVYMLQSGA
jgi:hypothetical protein